MRLPNNQTTFEQVSVPMLSNSLSVSQSVAAADLDGASRTKAKWPKRRRFDIFHRVMQTDDDAQGI